MNLKDIVDRNGKTFQWDEAEGYGWFSEISKNATKNGLAERMAFVKTYPMRDDDLLICAFPKAGTHWLWEITSMVVKGKAEYEGNSKIIAMLEFRSQQILDSIPAPRILNTHVYASCLPSDVMRKRTKIIHVMRHPKDIAVSFYHHFRQTNFCFEDPPYQTFAEFLPYITGEYGAYLLVSIFRYLQEFEKFSIDNPDMVLNLYYEDMKKNPQETVEKVAQFLGKQLLPTVVDEIVHKCSFVKLSEAEDNFKVLPDQVLAYIGDTEMSKLKKQGLIKFMRKGEIGDWKNHFTVAESEQFDTLLQKHLKDNMFLKRYW